MDMFSFSNVIIPSLIACIEYLPAGAATGVAAAAPPKLKAIAGEIQNLISFLSKNLILYTRFNLHFEEDYKNLSKLVR